MTKPDSIQREETPYMLNLKVCNPQFTACPSNLVQYIQYIIYTNRHDFLDSLYSRIIKMEYAGSTLFL